MERPLLVMIIARQAMARAGLRGLLAGRGDIAIVGDRGAFDEPGEPGPEPPPDVVLASWDPDADEVAALEAAAARTPIVLVGDIPTPRDLQAVLRAGVRGFLLADASPDDVSTALHCAYRGLLVLDPILARTLATAGMAGSPSGAEGEEPLTEREREVLELIAVGLPNKTIAARLGISEHTVKFHVGSVMAKLGAASRTEAVTRAIRLGLLAL